MIRGGLISNQLKHWGSKHVRIGLYSSNSPIFQTTRSKWSPARRLYVGGLPYAMDERGLREAFQEFGQLIDVRVMIDRESGRSRGFGYVSIEPSVGAENAIDAMDGKEICGRRIKVEDARRHPKYDAEVGYETDEEMRGDFNWYSDREIDAILAEKRRRQFSELTRTYHDHDWDHLLYE